MSATNGTIEIHFAALAPKIEDQLKVQGFYHKDIEKFEHINKSIIMLYLHNFINDSTKEKMDMKLFKQITKGLKVIE